MSNRGGDYTGRRWQDVFGRLRFDEPRLGFHLAWRHCQINRIHWALVLPDAAVDRRAIAIRRLRPYIPLMPWLVTIQRWIWLAAIVCASGCVSRPAPRSPVEQAMFGAVSFRIHPTFTQIKDWSGNHKPDGIEAVVEFQDQFGDPTRAAGNLRFELYHFSAADPDHRGTRIAIWPASLATKDDQIAHWDAAARGYTFQLALPSISNNRTYVLSAQFDRPNQRLFDQLIIEPSTKEGFHGERRILHAPTDAPGHGL